MWFLVKSLYVFILYVLQSCEVSMYAAETTMYHTTPVPIIRPHYTTLWTRCVRTVLQWKGCVPPACRSGRCTYRANWQGTCWTGVSMPPQSILTTVLCIQHKTQMHELGKADEISSTSTLHMEEGLNETLNVLGTGGVWTPPSCGHPPNACGGECSRVICQIHNIREMFGDMFILYPSCRCHTGWDQKTKENHYQTLYFCLLSVCHSACPDFI